MERVSGVAHRDRGAAITYQRGRVVEISGPTGPIGMTYMSPARVVGGAVKEKQSQ